MTDWLKIVEETKFSSVPSFINCKDTLMGWVSMRGMDKVSYREAWLLKIRPKNHWNCDKVRKSVFHTWLKDKFHWKEFQTSIIEIEKNTRTEQLNINIRISKTLFWNTPPHFNLRQKCKYFKIYTYVCFICVWFYWVLGFVQYSKI